MNKSLEHIVVENLDASADLLDRLMRLNFGNPNCDVMAKFLDGICIYTPILKCIDYWPHSASKKELFRITSELNQSFIADMDLDPDLLSQVKEAFISAGLL